eukprot:Rhum_TRINITY_DN6864_c0_g1::Rhum_TRINITY_DN6864_c0_g1_i1::g.21104::m.21104
MLRTRLQTTLPRVIGRRWAQAHPSDVISRLNTDADFRRVVALGIEKDVFASMEALAVPADQVPVPNKTQIFQLCVLSAVPFIGFGIFDNMVMLTVGDVIDATFGVTMGFSTLAAAGLGQCVSDATGMTLQGFIERFSDRLGLPNPHLTLQQQELSCVKSWVQFARTLGIVVGCLIGMFPLLFLNTTRRCLIDAVKDELPEEKKKQLEAVMHRRTFGEGEKLMSCGERNGHVYVILQGEVEVVGRDNFDKPLSVCTLGPGNMVGELEVVNNHPCVADVIATEDVRVQAIARDDFLSVVADGDKTLVDDVFRENVKSSSRYVWYRMKMEKNEREKQEGKADEKKNGSGES